MKKASVHTNSENQFLLVAGLLVLLVGGPTVSSLMKDPAVQGPKVVAQSTVTSSRVPASVVNSNELKIQSQANQKSKAQTKKSLVVEFNCDDLNAKKEVNSGQVRISGESCKSAAKMNVMNKSNGFSASVIYTKNKKFTTDFIDLKEGENTFEIVATAKDGTQQTHAMKVIRRIPASASMDSEK